MICKPFVGEYAEVDRAYGVFHGRVKGRDNGTAVAYDARRGNESRALFFVDAVCDAVRSGVKVFASLHGKDTGAVLNSEIFAALAEVMELFVVLEAKPAVGKIVGVFTEKDLRWKGSDETENANVQAECGGKNES